MLEEASWRRPLAGGIWRRHLGIPRGHPEGTQKAPRSGDEMCQNILFYHGIFRDRLLPRVFEKWPIGVLRIN